MERLEGKGDLDIGAAVTRSLLGWGVVAGIFYLLVGVIHGLLRPRFNFAEHALSQLMLGDFGWVQRTNLILTGLMVIAAAVGFSRAMSSGDGGRSVGILLMVFGAATVGGGVFAPDPVDGFPEPDSTAGATLTGILHLGFGAIGFIAFAAAAFAMARWFTNRGEASRARWSRLSAAVILVGFLAGAALATNTVGVILIWIAVVAGWAWLATSSIYMYRTVPHPDLDKRRP